MTTDTQQQKPLFVPLRSEFFDAFCDGTKRIEYRQYGARWNERTCAVGRRVTISKGYGKQHRRDGVIVKFSKSMRPCRSQAWRACYGDDNGPAACITITLDEAGTNNRYPGGKGLAGVTQWLVGMMPTHSQYAEPFAGKAALLRNKPPARVSLLIDKDVETVAWLRTLAWPGSLVKHGDGLRWLETAALALDDDALVYVDPPYLPTTRKRLDLYRHELSESAHKRILRAVRRLRCRVMLSGYASKLYDNALHDWHRHTHEAITRGGTMATEVVWCNFDRDRISPALPVEYSALGDDYRERERVARKLRRWAAKLEALPARERAALLHNLIHVHQTSAASSGD